MLHTFDFRLSAPLLLSHSIQAIHFAHIPDKDCYANWRLKVESHSPPYGREQHNVFKFPRQLWLTQLLILTPQKYELILNKQK